MSKFCIYCGSPDSPDNPVVNGVCLRCRIKRGELVKVEKKSLRIDFCKVCGSVRIGYKWIETHSFEEAIGEIVETLIYRYVEPGPGVRDLKISGYELVTKASWRTVVRVYFSGLYGNKSFELPLDFVIYLNPTKCPRCKMIESGEFEAVVKIRGIRGRSLGKLLEKIFNSDRRLTRDLVDYIEGKEGVDIYFYNYGAARKFSRRLSNMVNLTYREDFEVAGMRSGKQRARLYISLRPKRE